MKPIEPGCLAMIVKSWDKALNGKVVEVESYTAANVILDGHLWEGSSWIVRSREKIFITVGGEATRRCTADESSLMRIDGHEPETRQEKHEVTA